MGARFELKHANIIGYLTDFTGEKAPRTTPELLHDFFTFLREPELSRKFQPPRLISLRGEWEDNIRRALRSSIEILYRAEFKAGTILSREMVGKLLAPIRPYFQNFPLYVMIVGTPDDPEIKKYWHRIPIVSESALCLFPESFENFVDFLDPFPPLQQLSETPVAAPFAVFWTTYGACCAIPLKKVDEFLKRDLLPILAALDDYQRGLSFHSDPRIHQHIRNPTAELEERIRKQASYSKTKKILHMSDLHFGKPEALRRRNYLIEHLQEILSDIDRVVITGDLFDSPKGKYKIEFDNFRKEVERITNNTLVVIPGNHDVRKKGNKISWLGEDYREVAGIDWSSVVIDDALKTIFLCFNSSEYGNFAKGAVSEEQRLSMASELLAKSRKIKNPSEYIKVALVHHHPLKYEHSQPPNTLYDLVLRKLGFGEDDFLEFENAKEFLNWCSNQQVSLVLHGHKHHPRQTINQNMLIVGCGSTTGVEGTPMCYDVITLDTNTGHWSTKFYHDIAADGSGFALQHVTLKL